MQALVVSWFRERYSEPPLWTAVSAENFPMFEALIEAGADIKEEIFTAAYHGFHYEVKLMIAKGADVNWREENGNTILITAAYDHLRRLNLTVAQRISCVKLIPKARALVNEINNNNDTALKRSISNYPIKYTRNLAELLFAAGEQIWQSKPRSKILRKLKAEEDELSLLAICRKSIRKHLLDLDPYRNLSQRVAELEVPHTVIDYMLFNWTLDVNENDDSDEEEEEDKVDSRSDDGDDDDDDDDDEVDNDDDES